MSRSSVDICNVGLGMVGASPITSLTEDSENARLCNQFYEPAVDEVLCLHSWKCAKHTKVITSDAGYDYSDYDYMFEYRYLLPANPYCLKVRKYNDGKTEYDIQGRYLYSSNDTCELVYTKRISDTNEFDPLLAEAIATRIAIKLSFPLQQSERTRHGLIEYLEKVVLQQAKIADGEEKYIVGGKSNWRTAGR